MGILRRTRIRKREKKPEISELIGRQKPIVEQKKDKLKLREKNAEKQRNARAGAGLMENSRYSLQNIIDDG